MSDSKQTVSAVVAKEWVKSGDAVIIDVRDPSEFATEHIIDAVNEPLGALDPKALDQKYADKKIIFQCASGKRAGEACQACCGSEESNSRFFVLEGSLGGWKQAGFPTTGNGKIPLDRQVLIVAGSMVLFFIAVNAPIISAAVGGGLIYAGISGNCMMKKLLMKLPYNQSA